jgi:hypothetical protein
MPSEAEVTESSKRGQPIPEEILDEAKSIAGDTNSKSPKKKTSGQRKVKGVERELT